jgi:hypothetical protein
MSPLSPFENLTINAVASSVVAHDAWHNSVAASIHAPSQARQTITEQWMKGNRIPSVADFLLALPSRKEKQAQPSQYAHLVKKVVQTLRMNPSLV